MRVYYCSHLSRSFSGTSYHSSVVKVLYVEADSILSVWCWLVKGERTKATDVHLLAPANRLLKWLAVFGVLNCNNLPNFGRDLSSSLRGEL